MQIAVVRAERANRAALRVETVHDALEKAAAQRLDIVRFMQEGGHFVERRQLAVLRGKLRRLHVDASFEFPVMALQLIRHAVEPFGEMTELVVRPDRQTRREVALFDARDAVFESLHRHHEPQVQQIDDRDRPDARHRGQRHLRTAQPCSLARVLLFDHANERVGLTDERREKVDVKQAFTRGRGAVGGNGRLERVAPVALDERELNQYVGRIGKEERAGRRAMLEAIERAFQQRDLGGDLGRTPCTGFVERHRDQRRAHAQTAGVVDRGARAF